MSVDGALWPKVATQRPFSQFAVHQPSHRPPSPISHVIPSISPAAPNPLQQINPPWRFGVISVSGSILHCSKYESSLLRPFVLVPCS